MNIYKEESKSKGTRFFFFVFVFLWTDETQSESLLAPTDTTDGRRKLVLSPSSIHPVV